jgi:uncharacterized protein involved in exopolysaccharide biosynthesis
MTTTTPRPSELEAEREVDLARWRGAVVRLWWWLLIGLVIGAIVGVLVSLRGGSNYQASALVSLGQPTSPGGAVINDYGQNPRAISQIVSSASAQAQAEQTAGMGSGALRGHVSVAQVGTATGAGAARVTPLIQVTVSGANQAKVETAANALAAIVVQRTTASYVGRQVASYQATLKNVNIEIQSVTKRLAAIQRALTQAQKQNLDPFQQLVIVSQEDNAETRYGNLIGQQNTVQQQLAFAQEVETARVVTKAKAVKASAHSSSLSAVIGAIVGIVIAAIAAIVADGRRRRA